MMELGEGKGCPVWWSRMNSVPVAEHHIDDGVG